MIKLNEHIINPYEIIDPSYINTCDSSIYYNEISFVFNSAFDFSTLEEVYFQVSNIPTANKCILNIPYIPYSYGNPNNWFNFEANKINQMNFEKVKTIEVSRMAVDSIKKIENKNFACGLGIRMMKEEIGFGHLRLFTPDPLININDLKSAYELAKFKVIYIFYASNFEEYNNYLRYDQILWDVGQTEPDCKKVIVIGDALLEVSKYELIADMLRTNMPNLEAIDIVCPHCTNKIYGSALLNDRLATKLLTTNSFLEVRPVNKMSNEERMSICIIDAFGEHAIIKDTE